MNLYSLKPLVNEAYLFSNVLDENTLRNLGLLPYEAPYALEDALPMSKPFPHIFEAQVSHPQHATNKTHLKIKF
jgi:hypothetical protein